MTKTRHATTNFRLVKPYLDALQKPECDGWHRFTSDGYEPFTVEQMAFEDRHGNPIYYLAQTYIQNGDLMADPAMEIAVNWTEGTVEPLNYRLDGLAVYQEVYKHSNDGKLLYSPRLRTELDDFLNGWLKNIHDQGFTPDQYEI